MVEGLVAISIFPNGAKADGDNQRSSPIAFTQLDDQKICPVVNFMKWLKVSKDSYTQFEIFKADDKKCSLIDKTIVIVFTF